MPRSASPAHGRRNDENPGPLPWEKGLALDEGVAWMLADAAGLDGRGLAFSGLKDAKAAQPVLRLLRAAVEAPSAGQRKRLASRAQATLDRLDAETRDALTEPVLERLAALVADDTGAGPAATPDQPSVNPETGLQEFSPFAKPVGMSRTLDFGSQIASPLKSIQEADAWSKKKLFGEQEPEKVTFSYDKSGNPTGESIERDGHSLPVLSLESDRIQSIVNDSPSIFRVAPNPEANANDPIHRLDWVGKTFVNHLNDTIEEEAGNVGVDPNLLRSVMFIETSQGHKFGLEPIAEGIGRTPIGKYLGEPDSFWPMNYNPNIWKGLGYSREDVMDPRTNVRAGATLLKRIQDRLEDPSIENVGTLYNGTMKEKVSDYGARVADIYKKKPWE